MGCATSAPASSGDVNDYKLQVAIGTGGESGGRLKRTLSMKSSGSSCSAQSSATTGSVYSYQSSQNSTLPRTGSWGDLKSGDSVVDNFFRENALFKRMSPASQRSARKYLKPRGLGSGEMLLSTTDKEGATPKEMFFLVQGAVKITRWDGVIETVGPGAMIGMPSFLHQTKQCETAIVTRARFDSSGSAGNGESMQSEGGAIVLVLTCEDFQRKGRAAWAKALSQAMHMALRPLVLSQIRENELFRGLPENTVVEMAKLFSLRYTQSGDVVFRQGDEADGFYLVSSGELIVTLRTETGLGVMVLKHLTSGDSFGELGILDRAPRSATVTALHHSMLFQLSRSSFDQLRAKVPEIKEEMHARISEQNEMRKLCKDIPFTKNLGPNTLHRLASVSVPVTYRPHEKILTQGQFQPSMFFILSQGSIDVDVNGDVKSLEKRGTYFGEISVMSDRPHSASVTAGKNGARCLACTKEDFLNVFEGEPALLSEVAIRVMGINCEVPYILQHPDASRIFLQHCIKEYAAENVEFYLAAEEIEALGRHSVRRDVLEALGHDIKQVVKRRFAELEAKSLAIFDRFIKPTAEASINIRSDYRDEITTHVERAEFSYTLFVEAKEEVLRLLTKDSFSRFQDSEDFAKLLRDLGAYTRNTTLHKTIRQMSVKKGSLQPLGSSIESQKAITYLPSQAPGGLRTKRKQTMTIADTSIIESQIID